MVSGLGFGVGFRILGWGFEGFWANGLVPGLYNFGLGPSGWAAPLGFRPRGLAVLSGLEVRAWPAWLPLL